MKKILTLFLVFALCLTAFVGCDNTNTGANSALESAKDYIRSMYKDDAEATPSDYNVVASTMVDGVKYDITWTVNITSGDTNGIKVVPGENNTVTIDVDEKATADIVYTLVGTIASPEGQTITVEFNRKVPAFAVMSYADYAAVEDDSAVVVRGIITGIFSATNGSSGNGMYIQDNNNEGGYYVYGFADSKDPEADLGLKVGMDVIVTGTKDTYNGLYEVVGAVVEIVNSEPATVTPVDYTDIFKNATDLAATDLVGKQSMLVTIKGVEITGQDTSNGYFKFKLGDKETYIRISSSNNCISKTEIETFKTTHTTNFGNTCDVTGIVQLFNGNFYLIPATVDAFTDITAVEKTDDQKVATEKDNLSFNSSLNKGGEYTLPTAGTIYTDVTITWVSDNAAAVVDGGKLTVTLPDADTTVNLTATLKCGSVTETKVFEVKLYAGALSYADIVDMAYGLAPGAALDGTYRLFGVITSIDTVWSDQYSNITVTIQIGDKTDKLIQCYRLKGDGAKDLKVGDAITVEGTIKNYNGTIEFDSGCILVGMGEIISQEAIVEEAYKLGVGEAMEGTQTLTGVITSVDT